MFGEERRYCLCRIKKVKIRFEKYENFSYVMIECKELVEREMLIKFKRRDLIIGKVKF